MTFKVTAYDAAGNVSTKSTASNSVTPAAPGAPYPASTILALSAGSITPVADGTNVPSWADSSGAGNNATSSGTVPKYYASVVNGKPVVRWVVGDSRYTSPASGSDAAQTIMVVVSVSSLSSGPAFLGASGNGGIAFYVDSGGALRVIVQGVTFPFSGSAGQVTTGSFVVLTAAVTSGSTKVYKNGTLLGTDTSTYTTTAGTTSTVGAANAANVFAGDIAEIVRANAVMTNSERIALHTYFGTKYGITMGGA